MFPCLISRSRVSNICSHDHHRNFEEIWSGPGCQDMVDTSKLGVGLETEVSKNLEETKNYVIVEEHYITCMFTCPSGLKRFLLMQH